eukprot:TRINITY_DN14360_c0_g1_i3.p1 TRINITY_DN14360_c0_g1~~TRINITY_DN14360_c0_g1_i3.p1  ORF type:complete len:543 (+),score=116.54 TRINITY_DN14360_c0_g1_i3:1000-2628(+)
MPCTPQSIDSILADILRLKGPLLKQDSDKAGGAYRKVWDAFNRYVSATLAKQRTLAVSNFCRIGWRIEDGPSRLKPYFQLADSFRRVYGVETRGQHPVSDDHLTPVDEFSYSKAALHFTQDLTKENIYNGLKAIVQQLGERMCHGQAVCLDLDVGRLVCGRDRDVSFYFAPEAYTLAGLEVPESAHRSDVAESRQSGPSVSFAKPSRDALSLRLSGAGANQEKVSSVTFAEQANNSASTFVSEGLSAGALAARRHMEDLKAEAAAAVADKEQWEAHLKRCADEEKRDAEWRRALLKDHSEHLKAQMQEKEGRRQQGREHSIQQASMHDFPNFGETVPQAAVAEYLEERRHYVRSGLEEQIREKKERRQKDLEAERALEAMHIEKARKDLERYRQKNIARKEAERNDLRDAWSEDSKLRNAKKAIARHNKASGSKSKSEVSEIVSELLGAGGAGAVPASRVSSSSGASSARNPKVAPGAASGMDSIMRATLPSNSLQPSELSDSGPPSARPLTGSVRRMPIGAAASLALYKERKQGGSLSARR